MKILGLNAGEFNTSASILIKGEIKAAVQEERFTRKKFTKEFPYNSIRYCLTELEFCGKIIFILCQIIFLICLIEM